jgi:hypothetical protein
MAHRRLTSFTIALALLGGSAGAQQGATSGPAAGSNTAPSAAIQKEGRSVGGDDYRGSAAAAGAPGIEGKPGAESGREPARISPDSDK